MDIRPEVAAGAQQLANGAPPAIHGTIERARGIRDGAEQLAEVIGGLADRVCGPLPPSTGSGAPPASPSPAYGPGLTDTFLSIHDQTEAAITRIAHATARIGSII